jgi:hypothetical protein
MDISVSKSKKSKKSTKKEKVSNDVPNVYDYIPKEFKTTYHNPNKEHHGLDIPFRMAIVGASGSGKTQLVLHILNKAKDTWGNIKIFTRNKSEPIYEYLEKKLPASHLQIYEGLKDLPSLAKDKDGKVNGFDKDLQHLVVFDDLCLEKDQSRLSEYFIRARKIAKGVSLMYLSQSYFAIPKVIRVNLNYMILKKLSSLRDLNLILSEYNLGLTKERMMEIYKYCTNEKTNFLMLDLDNVVEKRFRHNLLEVLDTTKEYKIKEIKEESPKKEKKKKTEELDSDSDYEIEGAGFLDGYMNRGLSLKGQRMLKLYGSVPISKIVVVKNVVNPLITKTLNTLSGQEFDRLYHLGIVVTLSNGKSIIMEKNASINISDKFSMKNREVIPVQIPNNLTLTQMVNNTSNIMGTKFIPYSGNGNNCQDFIIAVLQSNNILTDNLEQFVKQKTDPIFENRPILRKIVNTVTDLGGVVDNVIDNVTAPIANITGGAIVRKVIY